jgi:FixJ family two-component response regulator
VETFWSAQEFFSSLGLQRQLAESNFAIPIVFITGHGDIPMSVRANQSGRGGVSSQTFP